MFDKLSFKNGQNFVETTLSKISIVKDGTHDSPEYFSEGFPLITSKNLLENGKIEFTDLNYISKEDFDEINKRSKVEKGDILFGMIGTIGNPVICENNNFAIKNVALIKAKPPLNYYLFHYLKSKLVLDQFKLIKTGGTQKFIALNKIRELKILLPDSGTQQKISSFLSAIDKLNDYLEIKIKLFQDLKKHYLLGLFSEISSYKKISLTDICNLRTGDLNVENSGEGRYHFFDRSETIKRIDRFSYDGKAIIYAGEGSSFFPKLYEGKFGLHQRAYALMDFKDEANYEFVYYYLQTMNRHFLKTAVGTTVKSLRRNCFEKCEIKLPSLESQMNIKNFLINIDKQIQYLVEERMRTIELKKYYLKEIFK